MGETRRYINLEALGKARLRVVEDEEMPGKEVTQEALTA